MRFIPTAIPDVIIIEPRVFQDERGFFMETWHDKKFADGGINVRFVQDNHSRSSQGTLRGLHYQSCNPQGKLVRVTLGEVFDVAVDLRKSSPYFGKWVSVYLSDANKRMFWIPAGFAHGFYVLSDFAEFQYKCTDFYTPECDKCIRWDDPTLAINWPVLDGKPPVLSAKDEKGFTFLEADYFP